jgi:hypothetical protein
MLSSKINMDDTYSNRSWTIVGGNFFALKEVNQMERELFAFLGWNVVVKRDDLLAFSKRIEADHVAVRTGRAFRSVLPPLTPGALPPTPPPERERPKRRRESSVGCSRTARAEAAAIALLRPGSHHAPPLIRSSSARMASADSSADSSAVASPYSASPRTPASPETRSPANTAGGKALASFAGPVIYRAGSGFEAAY